MKARKEQANRPPKERARKTPMKKALDVLKESGLTPDEVIALITKAQAKAKSKAEQPEQ